MILLVLLGRREGMLINVKNYYLDFSHANIKCVKWQTILRLVINLLYKRLF